MHRVCAVNDALIEGKTSLVAAGSITVAMLIPHPRSRLLRRKIFARSVHEVPTGRWEGGDWTNGKNVRVRPGRRVEEGEILGERCHQTRCWSFWPRCGRKQRGAVRVDRGFPHARPLARAGVAHGLFAFPLSD
jgi:hypothetical protein